MIGRRCICAVAFMIAIVTACSLAGPQAVARDGRRAAANFSYCGFGTGAADSSMEPGGGGDTLVIDDPRGIYHFVYDSSSPVTLANHDRVLLQQIVPSDIELKRVDDSLAVCVASRQYELFIDGHYCRSTGLSETDTDNNEMEEITFVEAREIWLADVLYEERAKDPNGFPAQDGADYGGVAASEWKVRRFSEVLPDYARPATSCAR